MDPLEGRTLFSVVTVTNLSDHGPGSLRDPIASAHANDTVAFARNVPGTILLTTGELAVNKDLTIQGPGAGKLAVGGNDSSRVFDVTKAGAKVEIDNLTITHGSAPEGAGIDNAGGNLTVNGCTFTANQAAGISDVHYLEGRGGAIFNGGGGTLTVAGSNFFGNNARSG